jgi:hypothetical protein
MMLLTKDVEKRMPALYSQENVDDPTVVVKFFDPCSSATWFVTEGQREGDDFLMFGLCYIHEPELGYVALSELQEYKGPLGIGIERDKWWTPKPLSEARKELLS